MDNRDAEDELGAYAKPTLAETGFRPDPDSLLGRYWNWATGDDSPIRVSNWLKRPDENPAGQAAKHVAGLAGDQAMQFSPVQPADDVAGAIRALPGVYSPFAQKSGVPFESLGRSLGVKADVPPVLRMLGDTTHRVEGALDAARGRPVAPADSFPQPSDAGSVFMAAGAAEPLAGLARRLGLGEDAVQRAVNANADSKSAVALADMGDRYINGTRKSGAPIPTVKNAQRAAYPGIYERPDIVAETAAANTASESPWLSKLFGVTRSDLASTADRVGNEAPRVNFKPNPRGSDAVPNITTPKNTQRILDMLEEVKKRAPGMYNGMKGWYVMDPAYQRLAELVGPEEAKRRYNDFNYVTAAHSPGAPVEGELNRGSHALLAKNLGKLPDWEKYGGAAAGNRGADFPSWLTDNQGHPYHSESQMSGLRSYLENGDFSSMGSPKVPAYAHASGVPETGFQTSFPVGDAHFSRGVGLADVRTNASFGESAKMPEMQSLWPWWRDKVAGQAGLESVPAQAITWGAYGPATGVATKVGSPKLELLADRIADTAKRKGLNPEDVRDSVLLGKSGLVAPKPGGGSLFANRVKEAGVFGSNFAKLGYGDDIWHHGTTFDFKSFDDPSLPKNWNEEIGNNGRYFTGNYDGPGIYATSSKADALRNYSDNTGADINGKIGRMTDILEAAQGISPNAAKAIATKHYYGGKDQVLDLRMRKDMNPAIIDRLHPNTGAIAEEDLPKLRDSLYSALGGQVGRAGVPGDIIDRIYSHAKDRPNWYHVDSAFRNSQAPMYLWDHEMTPPGLAFQNIVKGMSKDAVLRKNIEGTFSRMGIDGGTQHLAKFTNKGIRHVDAEYDPAKADSTDIFSANPRSLPVVDRKDKKDGGGIKGRQTMGPKSDYDPYKKK